MATKKVKKEQPADPREALKGRIVKAKAVLSKHVSKARQDAKRRLAVKKLKRAQRGLGKLVAMDKKRAAAAAKKAAPKE